MTVPNSMSVLTVDHDTSDHAHLSLIFCTWSAVRGEGASYKASTSDHNTIDYTLSERNALPGVQ